MRRLLLILALCLSATSLSAQTPRYRLVFQVPSNHDAVEHGVPVVERYDLIVSKAGKDVATVNVGKPTPDAQGTVTHDVHVPLIALPDGPDYTARVVAIGAGGATTSIPSDPFPLKPLAPGAVGKPIVQRAASPGSL